VKSPRVTAWGFKSLRGHSWGHNFDTIMPKTLATATVDRLLRHATSSSRTMCLGHGSHQP
jgi:hypothetical protein